MSNEDLVNFERIIIKASKSGNFEAVEKFIEKVGEEI